MGLGYLLGFEFISPKKKVYIVSVIRDCNYPKRSEVQPFSY